MNIKAYRNLTRSLSRSLVVIEKEGVSCCGLPILQSHILIELGESGKLSLNELAKKLAADKASVSRAVQSLVEKEFIIRNAGTNDRRAVVISLSDKGLSNYNEISKEMDENAKSVLNHFDKNEIEDLMYYLNKLEEAISTVNQKNNCKDNCK